MSHPHTTHRRNLATLDPKTPMDPTLKKQSKPHHQHPTDPDPTIASSTIHNISKKFSNLYVTNHQKLTSRPNIDTHLQAKAMSLSAIEDTTNHPKRRTVVEKEEKVKESQGGHQIIKRAIVRGKTEKVVKKSSKKERVKMEQSNEGHDPKRSSVSSSSLSRNQESELKEAHEGGVDMKRPFSLAVTGGRRRSFSNSQTELADFFSCAGVKIVSVDMPPFMQVHAVDCARKTYDSLEKFTSKTLAFTLKKEFDGVYGPAWHCIVGTSFGSFVTHSVGGFLYFSMDHKLYVLLFKTTVRRAD